MYGTFLPSIDCFESVTVCSNGHIQRHSFCQTLNYEHILAIFLCLKRVSLCRKCVTRLWLCLHTLLLNTEVVISLQSFQADLIQVVDKLLFDLLCFLKRLDIDQMLIAESSLCIRLFLGISLVDV